MKRAGKTSEFLRRRTVRGLLVGALGTAVAASAGVGMNLWIERVARPHLYDDIRDVPPRRVAIVPGAKVHPSGQPSLPLEDRLATALSLYRAGKVQRILVSGDHAAPEYDETNAMWRWLSDRGVPSEHIFLDHAGFRTLDTMGRARRVFQVEDAVICTQTFHLPRSVFLARRAGMDAVGLSADRREYVYRNYNRLREFVARSVAFLDSYVFRTQPRHLGDQIPIAGDGRQTHDRWTR